MKRLLVLICSVFFINTVMAQEVTLTNTFGADVDNTSTRDFILVDSNGNKNSMLIGDRIQLDVGTEDFDGRVRLNFSSDKTFSLKGYGNVRPVKYLNIAAGNYFFWKWSIDSAYLMATEDFLSHGKLLDDDGVGAVLNFDTDKVIYQVAGGIGASADTDANFGLQIKIKDISSSFGATFQNVTENKRTISAYASTSIIPNFTFNIGYIYNPTDTWYICGQQNSIDYCKHLYTTVSQSSTQHLIQASVGYTYEKFGAYTDLMIGLNNKYYNNGNFDSKLNDGIPVYAAIKVSYNVLDNVVISTQCKYNHWLGTDKSYDAFSVYPMVSYTTKKVGTFNVGARIFFNAEDGFNGFNIPFTWKYKFTIM